MSVREYGFSPEKALESVLFIASRLQNPGIHEVLKLRYFADKIHFSEHGFLASGDQYCAMKFGPVASGTYDLLKAARGDLNEWANSQFSTVVAGALVVDRNSNSVRPQRDANLEFLSRSDIDALTRAIEQYGNMDFGARTELSHDSAWTAAWAVAQEEHVGQSPMALESIAKTLENAEEVVAHIHA